MKDLGCIPHTTRSNSWFGGVTCTYCNSSPAFLWISCFCSVTHTKEGPVKCLQGWGQRSWYKIIFRDQPTLHTLPFKFCNFHMKLKQCCKNETSLCRPKKTAGSTLVKKKKNNNGTLHVVRRHPLLCWIMFNFRGYESTFLQTTSSKHSPSSSGRDISVKYFSEGSSGLNLTTMIQTMCGPESDWECVKNKDSCGQTLEC